MEKCEKRRQHRLAMSRENYGTTSGENTKSSSQKNSEKLTDLDNKSKIAEKKSRGGSEAKFAERMDQRVRDFY